MDRFPKVVATFNYAGAVNPLRNKLNGAILNAIRPTILALRDAAELVEKIEIVQFTGNTWQYYPKVVTTRPFTEAEYAQVNAAVQTVSTTLVTELTNEGATNIVIHAHGVS
jgi:hypothetical protein